MHVERRNQAATEFLLVACIIAGASFAARGSGNGAEAEDPEPIAGTVSTPIGGAANACQCSFRIEPED